MAREIARPSPAPAPRARGLAAAAVERLEHARAVVVADPVAGVGDLDLDAAVRRLGEHGHRAVGRRVADRVLDQVEQHALDLLGVRARRLLLAHVGAHADALRVGLGAQRVDRLLDELVERHLLERPLDVARLQPRQLEQVVDQPREHVDVRAHLPEIAAPGLRVDDVVADRLGEQPQRGDRRAQVMRHGGDQVAARGLGVAELADRRVDRPRQLGELVGAPVDSGRRPRAVPDRDQRVAQRLDVPDRGRREQLRGAHRDRAREHDDDHEQQRVVGGDEHELRRDGREHHELADGHRDADGELAAQRPAPRAPAREHVREAEHPGAQRGEPQPHQEAVAEPVADRDRPGERGAHPEHEHERGPQAHGWNR